MSRQKSKKKPEKKKFVIFPEPFFTGEHSGTVEKRKRRLLIPSKLVKIISARNRYHLHSPQFQLKPNLAHHEIDIVYKDKNGQDYRTSILINPHLPKRKIITADQIDWSNLDSTVYTKLRMVEDNKYALCLYPALDWAIESARVRSLPPNDYERMEFFRNYASLDVHIENNNMRRITLPKHLTEKAGLEGKVTIIGNGNLLELWNPKLEKDYSKKYRNLSSS